METRQEAYEVWDPTGIVFDDSALTLLGWDVYSGNAGLIFAR